MKLVAVVDYGMGNVDSVSRAVQECGAQPVLTARAEDLAAASAIILPGVGAFGDGMRQLNERGLPAILTEQVVGRKVPFLGICLGMQLLCRKGFENGDTAGLGWLDADCVRLEPKNGERVPHVGWNAVNAAAKSPLLAGVEGKDFYFVHSYHVRCRDGSALARTPYCGEIVSAVAKDNVFGVQFHPEKSQKSGFALLRNFLAL